MHGRDFDKSKTEFLHVFLFGSAFPVHQREASDFWPEPCGQRDDRRRDHVAEQWGSTARGGSELHLGDYVRAARLEPRLSAEEEVELAGRIAEGDEAALDLMVRANLRIVIRVARKYIRRHVFLSDLVNEGNIGLIKAAKRYDPSFGLRFVSYAIWWVKQSIILFLIRHSKGLISIPIRKVIMAEKAKKESEILQCQLGRRPTLPELAKHLKIAPETLDQAVNAIPDYVGWEEYLEGNHQVASPLNGRPMDAQSVCERNEARSVIGSALSELSGRERTGIELFYGLRNGQAQNYADIGRELDMSREGARQLVKRSLRKLRESDASPLLRSLLA